jgi:hypothetical protein
VDDTAALLCSGGGIYVFLRDTPIQWSAAERNLPPTVLVASEAAALADRLTPAFSFRWPLLPQS